MQRPFYFLSNLRINTNIEILYDGLLANKQNNNMTCHYMSVSHKRSKQKVAYNCSTLLLWHCSGLPCW